MRFASKCRRCCWRFFLERDILSEKNESLGNTDSVIRRKAREE